MSVENGKCPRCGGPADEARTGFGFPRPGALSRWDNSTTICTSCGQDEALAQFAAGYATGARGWARLAVDPVNGVLPWAEQPQLQTTE